MGFTMDSVPDQTGRVAIVTGANAGLGYETALALAKKGAKVILAVRNKQRGLKAQERILAIVSDADLEVRMLDLGNLEKVKEFAKGVRADYNRLDLLINNAGVMVPPYSQTVDKFELQMGVNYFGHFLLTGELLPLLEQTDGSRIVTLSSKAHERGVIDFDNLHAEKGYSKWGAYGQSKLACLMLAVELDRRLKASGSKVISVAAHPGISNTELGRHFNMFIYILAYPIFLFMIHSPEKAALPTLMGALNPNVQGGDYFGPTGRRGTKGPAGKVKALPHAYDEEVARKLWEKSEELVNFKYEFQGALVEAE